MRRINLSILNRSAVFSTICAVVIFFNAFAASAAAVSAQEKPPAKQLQAGHISYQQAAPVAYVDKVRFKSDDEVFRLVFDMTAIPAYTVSISDMPLQLEIELPDTINRSGTGLLTFNDSFVEKLQFTDLGGGRLKAYVPLKFPVTPHVSVMSSPTRLVVDLMKTRENRTEQEVSPGVTYREILRGRQEGPVKAYVLEVDLKAGNTLKPILSNDAVAGLEVLSEMAERTQGIAMINGPYFMRNGEILGLLKIDKTIVSSPDVIRTSVGLMPDGRLIFDTASFSGYVELPDGSKVPIDGVNRSRGTSELMLYNPYYAFWTMTAGDGVEYTIRGDRVVDTHLNNSVIPDGAVVLSASGRPAWLLSGLKTGSKVKIFQSLGATWDRAVHAVGAGPCLVKDGQIYVTTVNEEFGSDVAGGRAPRTAIGVDSAGKALLVVVDGRRRTSLGLTLYELAQFMLELGAVDAMNLDGGGSSEMIVGSRIVNQPSDGRERRIGAGIAVIRSKPLK